MEDFIFDLQRFAFSGGSGTQTDPYLISTAADLNQLASDVNGGTNYSGTYFKLANDIDLKDANFTAIGCYDEDYEGYYFSGTFDGGGHTISNLKLNNWDSDCQGLFGLIDGKVKNVTLKDANVTGNMFVGAVVGENHDGEVSNCLVISSTVSGSTDFGTVVGYNYGTVRNCYYYNTTPASDYDDNAEEAYKLTLPAGVTLAASSRGVYYDGAVYAAADETITLTSNEALMVGGTNLTSTGENTYTYTMTAADATAKATGTDFLGSLTKDTTDTSGKTYLITTAAELQDLATYVNGGKNCAGLTFKLANNIDLKDVANFTAIGTENNTFSGTFDGGEHTISNLTINNASSNYQGLFGSVANGSIVKNVKLFNANVTGGSYVGGLVGYSNGTVDNCIVLSSKVVGKNNFGAVVGVSIGTGMLNNCYYCNTTPKSGGTEAYKLTLSEGVTATGGTTFTVDGVTYYGGTFTISGMVAGSTITIEGTTFTETGAGLKSGDLTLTGLTKSKTTAAGWSFSDSTATYKNTAISAGYKLANNKISYVGASGGDTLVTVKGVKSKDGLSLSDKTVTVANASLNQGTVTISKGYTLALGDDVTKTETTSAGWSFSGTTATYKNDYTSAGYKLDNNQIVYKKKSGGATLITVSGVKSKNGISLSDKTVTVAASALNQGTVTVSKGYTLALGDDVTEPAKIAAAWSLSGTTATYKKASTSAGYVLSNNKISYKKASGGDALITVKGVKSKSGISLSGKKVTVAASALNKGTVTVSDGYTLALADDVKEPKTTAAGWTLKGTTATYKKASTSAYYKLSNNQITYKAASGGETLVTVSGVKSSKGISLSGKTVTISKSALNQETVTVSDGYTLALADDVTKPETYAANEYDPATMTYTTKGATAGYTLADNKITYSKGTATKLKFSGVADGAKVADFSLKNKTMTIGKAAVKTDGTPLKLSADEYTLKLGKNMAAPKTSTTTTSTSGLSVTKGYLLSGNTIEYVNENVEIKNSDGKFSMDGKISEGRTFKGTSKADKVTVTGAFNLQIETGAGNDAVTLNGKNSKVYGGAGNDTLTGGSKADTLSGGAGNDILIGGTGNDTLTGGAGNDVFVHSAGNDVVTDYTASDKFSFKVAISEMTLNNSDVILKTSKGTLTVQDGKGKTLNIVDSTGKAYSTVLGGEDMTLTDAAASSIMTNSGIKQINASKRTDAIQITGNKLNNSIVGGSGKDSLYGGDGKDTLDGGAGNDKLYGGNGKDTIIGGKGNDSLWGDAGADTFVYNAGDGNDVIFGFEETDTLLVGSLDFTTSYANNVFTLKFDDGSIQFKNFTASNFHINSTTISPSND